MKPTHAITFAAGSSATKRNQTTGLNGHLDGAVCAIYSRDGPGRLQRPGVRLAARPIGTFH
jgi:hypothetical protein